MHEPGSRELIFTFQTQSLRNFQPHTSEKKHVKELLRFVFVVSFSSHNLLIMFGPKGFSELKGESSIEGKSWADSTPWWLNMNTTVK